MVSGVPEVSTAPKKAYLWALSIGDASAADDVGYDLLAATPAANNGGTYVFTVSSGVPQS